MDFSMLTKKLVTITFITANLYPRNVVTLFDIYHMLHMNTFSALICRKRSYNPTAPYSTTEMYLFFTFTVQVRTITK